MDMRTVAPQVVERRQQVLVAADYDGGLLGESFGSTLTHHALIDDTSVNRRVFGNCRPGWYLPKPRWMRLLGEKMAQAFELKQCDFAAETDVRFVFLKVFQPRIIMDDSVDMGRRLQCPTAGGHDHNEDYKRVQVL